jgi:Arc/MetJ-type ribon-helix-helix transcriptional regulator
VVRSDGVTLTPPRMGGIIGGMTPKRRASPDDPLAKTGYRIPQSLVMRVREAVDAGEARSQNEFVERALRRELRAAYQRRLYSEYAEAASDPTFLAEMQEVHQEWDSTIADGISDEDG